MEIILKVSTREDFTIKYNLYIVHGTTSTLSISHQLFYKLMRLTDDYFVVKLDKNGEALVLLKKELSKETWEYISHKYPNLSIIIRKEKINKLDL